MLALLLFNAMLGGLLAAVLLRAGWRRRENQLLALTALVDAGHSALTAVLVVHGVDVTSKLPIQICLISRILVVYPMFEFLCTFPAERRPPWRVRAVGLGGTTLTVAAAIHPVTAPWIDHWLGRSLIFVPVLIASLRVVHYNLSRLRTDAAARGARPVLLGLLFIASAELFIYTVVRTVWPDVFVIARGADLVLTVLIYAVIAHAVLKHHFFRVRGVIAEAVLYGTLSLSCLTLVVLAAEFVADRIHQPLTRSLAFAAVVLLPTAAWVLIERYAPVLETALLSPFDPRRQLRKTVLERILHRSVNLTDAPSLCELTRGAIGALSGGRVVLYLPEERTEPGWRARVHGSALPSALIAPLAREEPLHVHNLEQLSQEQVDAFKSLGADALVGVRAQDKLWCAFALDGGTVDQDTLDTARALANNLGTKLAHYAAYERAFELQNQLDTSRRLATLGSLAAAIAHDIRTPLTSVKMNVEMLRASAGLSPDMRDCTEIALTELSRMNDYVSGMLDYVKPVQLRAVECDIGHILDETVRALQPLLEARDLSLNVECASPGPPVVRADASRMKQILVNLLENAADASAPGSTIRVATSRIEGGRVAIRVSDEGHGIDASHLERIFEPFFTTRTEGTGLGLAIVSKLVHAHQGEVRVDSKLGAGSTFTVVLPA